MGLRHLIVVDGELMVKGIITRSDMTEHTLEHYWKEEVSAVVCLFCIASFHDDSLILQGETMIKEMTVDTLPPAIGYEPKADERMYRRRSASVQSNNTVETVESEIDVEILLNDLEVSDSPNISIRKRIAP